MSIWGKWKNERKHLGWERKSCEIVTRENGLGLMSVSLLCWVLHWALWSGFWGGSRLSNCDVSPEIFNCLKMYTVCLFQFKLLLFKCDKG